jgi:hypothetical protein
MGSFRMYSHESGRLLSAEQYDPGDSANRRAGINVSDLVGLYCLDQLQLYLYWNRHYCSGELRGPADYRT